MEMIGTLSALDSIGLSALRTNAEWLQHAGSESQKAAAASLLPAIEAELAARRHAMQQRKATPVRNTRHRRAL